MAAFTPDLTTATPRLQYFHIAGPSTREYLSEDLQQFIAATGSYFELRNKFRQTVVAPTRNVTTEKALLPHSDGRYAQQLPRSLQLDSG